MTQLQHRIVIFLAMRCVGVAPVSCSESGPVFVISYCYSWRASWALRAAHLWPHPLFVYAPFIRSIYFEYCWSKRTWYYGRLFSRKRKLEAKINSIRHMRRSYAQRMFQTNKQVCLRSQTSRRRALRTSAWNRWRPQNHFNCEQNSGKRQTNESGKTLFIFL